ncbi:MAG TPA: serine hydrolase domain-containing protein [Gemmatimonadaceae bacterium]|nr:serine hydrolase domain-containing protein [Gemmatimonadaceae bacterium]
MGIRKLTLLTLVVIGACHPKTPIEQRTTTGVTRSVLMMNSADLAAPRWIAEHGVPSIAVAYIENGAVQWTRVYGEQSEGIPATARTLYNVASLAKPVFAEVVMRLVDEGRLSLDEPIASHWVDPDVTADPRHEKLTLRLALSHRTGFPNWRSQDGGRLRFKADPGTALGYSGEGYEYAKRYIERKLRTSFDSLAHRYVLEPFGMTNTAFTRQDWFESRIALPNGPEGIYGKPSFQPVASASDDLYTTAADYAAFVVGVMNRTGLSAEIADARDSLHVLNPRALPSCDSTALSYCPRRIGMSLGWEILEFRDEIVRLHTGGDWGENTMAFYFPKRNAGAVMLTNSARGMKVVLEVIDLLFHDSDFARLALTMR